MKKAVIIAASPRKNGNSDIMAAAALKALEEKNVASEIIYLRELNFSPCIACGACTKTGQCALQDDMQKVYPKLLEAHIIILAAPIFFQSLGALCKSFIDRAQRFWSVKFVLKENVIPDANFRAARKSYALFCGGTNLPDTFSCAEKIFRLYGMMLEAKYIGGSFFPAVDEKGAIKKDPQHLAKLVQDVQALV